MYSKAALNLIHKEIRQAELLKQPTACFDFLLGSRPISTVGGEKPSP